MTVFYAFYLFKTYNNISSLKDITYNGGRKAEVVSVNRE